MISTELLDVLIATRELLARPENDFAWSSWMDCAAALQEMDDVIANVRTEHVDKRTLDVLFAPTGPIQEVSLGSGWGDEFLAIAERYDNAIANVVRARGK
jgi:hypothetical protein